MLRKTLYILWFMISVAALIFLFPQVRRQEAETDRLFILRVWNAEKEPAVGVWLRKESKAYEKAAGRRVYIRAVSGNETEKTDALPPDIILGTAGKTAVALRGYALFLRDESAAVVTPAPTGALFYRPSATPSPTATPAPWPEAEAIGAVLSPPELLDALPGTVGSADPAGDFSKGKASAALLTAGQSLSLPFGYRVYALPQGKGFLPVKAASFSDEGAAFLRFLLADDAQKALQACGLYSPFMTLYPPDDPIRFLIDGSRGNR